MSQAALAPLTAATISGEELATKLVDFEQAYLSQHSGSSRPSYIVEGMIWLDSTANPRVWKYFDGLQDIVIAQANHTTHRFSKPDEVTLASATTTDVLGSGVDFIAISGTSTISSLGSEPNQVKFVRATGAFTLTHNATSLILPTAANITAAAGDTFIVVSDASGNARVLGYQRGTGVGLVIQAASVPSGSVMLWFQTNAPSGWTKDTTNFNDHAIRIVTGTPSSGGSLNFSSVFGKTGSDAHTLTTAQLPSHTHGPGSLAGSGSTNTTGSHSHSYGNAGGTDTVNGDGGTNVANTSSDTSSTNGSHSHSVTVSCSGSTASAGSGSGHSHNMDIRVRYVDAIRATKN